MFSVIIPCFRRPEIGATLAANASLFARHGAEVLIVSSADDPSGGRGASLPRTAGLNVRHVMLAEGPFNKCRANNLGAFSSSGALLFFLDSDIVLTSDLLRQAQEVLDTQRAFVTVARVRESHPRPDPSMPLLRRSIETRELVCPDGREAMLRFEKWGDGSRSGSGLILVRRDDFLDVGGFNSAMTGWGFEDMDLQLRLQFAIRLTSVAQGEVLHLTHGDDKRNIASASRFADHERNMDLCIDNYTHSKFTGTYSADVAWWRQTSTLPLVS